MQLKNNPMRTQLAAATMTLLGAAGPAHAADADQEWELDAALLLYAESDGRVQAAEPVLKLNVPLGAERMLGAKLVVDTLTGSTPNGATPASTPQTFTGPSGGLHTYTAQPGELPLDDTFLDTRFALSADYSFALAQNGKLALGLNGSTEYDFTSFGGSLRYALDLNQRNTTLSASLGYEADDVDPVGGTPVPLSTLPPVDQVEGPGEPRGGSESKDVTDLVLGVTQLIDADSLVQVNYSLSSSSGYHTDPYKILSVVDANGEPLRYVHEGRPDSAPSTRCSCAGNGSRSAATSRTPRTAS